MGQTYAKLDATFEDVFDLRVLDAACSVEEIESICSGFATYCGYTFFQYIEITPVSLVDPSFFVLSQFPEAWKKRYFLEKQISHDPVLAMCQRGTTPVAWNALELKQGLNIKQEQFLIDSRNSGLHDGISFPLHLPGSSFAIFSLAKFLSGKPHSIDDTTLFCQILMFTMKLQANLDRVRRGDSHSVMSGVKLTRREEQCVLLASEGMTSEEISQNLNVVEATVIFHLQNAARKLKASNRVQAVARAISMGAIGPRI